ncbi:MAG: sterol desaturase/sphingolipid hydroxylase (fatty acid hydroxylase superfamily) [Bradymonadia bacterium]|jgi:sterol desaturase/sphingolipid hydroxylase (fatty acid hydroxylase superfamily)
MSVIKSLFAFALIMGGALTAATLMRASGVHPSIVVPTVTIAGGALVLIMQRFAAFSDGWRDYGHDLKVDLVHAIVSTGGAPALLELFAIGWIVVAAEWASAALGVTLWPASLPLVLQLALALIIGDFGAYWLHRLAHRSSFVWRFHAVHHSSEKLYGVNSARNHPINVAGAYLASVGPLVLLGAPGEALLLLSIYTSVNGLVQHSNADLNFGIFDWIFASPALHRRHHHVEIERSNTNFGSNLIFWDVVFGTRALPRGERNDEVGLPDMTFRSNFWQHLGSPFRIAKLSRDVVESTTECVRSVYDPATVLVVADSES